jgi:DNA-directed RNA polymerase specialized sigma24 family protein
MTAAQPPIDQDVLVGLRQGDDRSLEQLFRERYPGLIQEASTQLDDPAGAPRVVETAFRRVWDERASFETPDALDSFLHTAVREGAVREAKRLATLHRIEAGAHIRVAHHATATPTVDQAWSHLSSTIHAAPADLEAIKKARTAHARHEAAEHLKSWIDAGYFADDVNAMDYSMMMSRFIGGESVFIFNGDWESGSLDQQI